MPRITEEHREARRAQILDAARACLVEHGLEAVSMEMIIARSGLSTGAVYRYFKGKDEIMGATVAAPAAEIAAAVAQLIVTIALGYVAQRALTGDADIRAHADALAALSAGPGAAPERGPGLRG